MRKKDKRIIQTFKTIEEEIGSLSLSDSERWIGICSKLEGVIKDIPKKKMSGLYELLFICLDGFTAIYEKSPKCSLSLVDALFEALTAAEHYLLENPYKEHLVSDATNSLKKLLGKSSTTDAMDSGQPQSMSVKPAIHSLHDAAAFLVQLEPDDASEWDHLKSALSTLAADQSYSDSLKKYIRNITEKIPATTEDDEKDVNSLIKEIGALLEAAAETQSIEDQEEKTENENSDTKKDDNGSQQNEPVKASRSIEERAQEHISPEDHALPEDADMELLGEFLAEGGDLVAKAEEALLALETDPEDMEAIGTVFRAFHTIKGNSAFLELTQLSEMAHHAESLLSRVRDGEIRYSGGYADLALRALDMLKELMQSVQEAMAGNALSTPDDYNDLMYLLANPELSTQSQEGITKEPAPRVGDILVAQGSVEREKVEAAAAEQDGTPIGVKMVRDNDATVKDVAQALRTQERMKGGMKSVDSSIRDSTDRLDRLIDTVGELVIAHSMVAQDEVVVNSNHYDLLKKVTHTSKIVRELQDMSMSMRMIPLKSTFQKMARLVRDVARKVGKQVNFVTEGEETEIDRNMVDVIADPLMHMVRNAVDHGIELPDERERSGKTKHGTVKLSAYHSAGSVIVEIYDDGKGIARESILEKARERGIINDGICLSEKEVFNLIFEPGFSTAKTVTDVSGRGVGMDVVKRNIEKLRGQVEIQSELGKGSVFRMRLPLTLAIIDGMVVRVAEEKYIIPTVSIVRSIKPEQQDLSSVLNQGEMLALKDSLIPLFRLGSLFSIDTAGINNNQSLIVVIEDDGKQAGLFIDELIGRQQVVVKSLGESMRAIPGISGGAIMPNGRVGLILDVGGLVRLATANGEEGIREDA